MPTLAAIYHGLLSPFHMRDIELKPGQVSGGRALAFPFVDYHLYQARLDDLAGPDGWRVEFRPFDAGIVACRLEVLGVVREDVGEAEEEGGSPQGQAQGKRRGANPMFGGVAQAFRRASAAFGLGRYLYFVRSVWGEYDPKKRGFADPVAVVAEIFEGTPYWPPTRLKRLLIEAKTEAELKRAGEAVAVAFTVGDITEKERAGLKGVYAQMREALQKSAPPSQSSPLPKSTQEMFDQAEARSAEKAGNPPPRPQVPSARSSAAPAGEGGAGGATSPKSTPRSSPSSGASSPAPKPAFNAAEAIANRKVIRSAKTPAELPSPDAQKLIARVAQVLDLEAWQALSLEATGREWNAADTQAIDDAFSERRAVLEKAAKVKAELEAGRGLEGEPR